MLLRKHFPSASAKSPLSRKTPVGSLGFDGGLLRAQTEAYLRLLTRRPDIAAQVHLPGSLLREILARGATPEASPEIKIDQRDVDKRIQTWKQQALNGLNPRQRGDLEAEFDEINRLKALNTDPGASPVLDASDVRARRA